MMNWNTVAVVGVGLIGGSIGLALRKRVLAANVVGVGRRQVSLDAAKSCGAITAGVLSISSAAADADVVVVCTPVDQIAEHVLEAAAAAPGRALLTDAGSTKAAIVAAVEASLPVQKRFIGSHPLAGSEKTGCEFASADLFEGRVVVITPTNRTKSDVQDAAVAFWESLGASVKVMSPESHDEAVAATSHVPHLVAACVARETPRPDLELTAGGWRDLTRIAGGDPELWTQILLQNREHVLKSLSGFEKTMSMFRSAIERGDHALVRQLLTEGKVVRDALGN